MLQTLQILSSCANFLNIDSTADNPTRLHVDESVGFDILVAALPRWVQSVAHCSESWNQPGKPLGVTFIRKCSKGSIEWLFKWNRRKRRERRLGNTPPTGSSLPSFPSVQIIMNSPAIDPNAQRTEPRSSLERDSESGYTIGVHTRSDVKQLTSIGTT